MDHLVTFVHPNKKVVPLINIFTIPMATININQPSTLSPPLPRPLPPSTTTNEPQGPNDVVWALVMLLLFLMFYINLFFTFLGSNYVVTMRRHQDGTHTHTLCTHPCHHCKPLLTRWMMEQHHGCQS
jgi:hypothetical protein